MELWDVFKSLYLCPIIAPLPLIELVLPDKSVFFRIFLVAFESTDSSASLPDYLCLDPFIVPFLLILVGDLLFLEDISVISEPRALIFEFNSLKFDSTVFFRSSSD